MAKSKLVEVKIRLEAEQKERKAAFKMENERKEGFGA